MLENFTTLFKKVTKKEQIDKSKDAAKERLHLVLMQDRANVSADFLDMMKQEIVDVIKKYIDVDETDMDVKLENRINNDGTSGAPALYANIPIMGINEEKKKESEELRKSKKMENEEETEKNKDVKPETKAKSTKKKTVSEKKSTTKDTKATTKRAKKSKEDDEKIKEKSKVKNATNKKSDSKNSENKKVAEKEKKTTTKKNTATVK